MATKGVIKIKEEDKEYFKTLGSKRKITWFRTNPPVVSERVAFLLTNYPNVLGNAIREQRKYGK